MGSFGAALRIYPPPIDGAMMITSKKTIADGTLHNRAFPHLTIFVTDIGWIAIQPHLSVDHLADQQD